MGKRYGREGGLTITNSTTHGAWSHHAVRMEMIQKRTAKATVMIRPIRWRKRGWSLRGSMLSTAMTVTILSREPYRGSLYDIQGTSNRDRIKK